MIDLNTGSWAIILERETIMHIAYDLIANKMSSIPKIMSSFLEGRLHLFNKIPYRPCVFMWTAERGR